MGAGRMDGRGHRSGQRAVRGRAQWESGFWGEMEKRAHEMWKSAQRSQKLGGGRGPCVTYSGAGAIGALDGANRKALDPPQVYFSAWLSTWIDSLKSDRKVSGRRT